MFNVGDRVVYPMYGANAYNTTIEGEMFLHNKKSKVIQSIMETLGSFTGKVLRECLE